MYLLPAGTAARNNRKLQGLSGMRRLGSAASEARVFDYRSRPVSSFARVASSPGEVYPKPVVWQVPFGPASPQATYPPYVPPVTPPRYPPVPAPTAAIPGSPVPANYPTNQIFVYTDGTQWQFFPAQGAWVNLGIPYGTNSGTAAARSTTTSALDTGGTPAAPVSVSVAPSSSSFQPILDWLSQNTLIAAVPNWVPTAGVALLAFKFMGGKR